MDAQTPTTVYASTSGGGMFKSTDTGQNWTPLNTGLVSSELFFGPALQVSPSGACVHAGTQMGIVDFVNRPDLCAPPINLMAIVDRSSIEKGETLVASVGVMSPGASGMVDLYLGILMPDGTAIAFTSSGGVALGIADLASFPPVAAGVPLETPFAVAIPNFFSYQWTGSEPRGSYLFFLFTTQAGALADGVVTADELLGFAAAPFTFP